MAFEKRSKAKSYEPQDGDTLESIAAREEGEGNPVTWEELAKYNWGTADEKEVEGLMRDELGARARNGDRRFVVSSDDEPRGGLKIPKAFQQEGFATDQTHVIRVRKKECPKQLLACTSIPGVTFGFDSSFILPSIVDQLKVLEGKAKEFPDAKVMVFGHTDAVGDDDYNKQLSERRAWSVHAFITNDADAWETLYNHPKEEWGLEAVQEILTDLGHEPGPVDGDWGPKTRGAMRRFLGLPEDAAVQNDAAFRKELFAAYMASKHDVDLGPDRFADPGYMGCGEFNPVEAGGGASEANRRVSFFLFHPDRLPNLPCAFADCAPCRRQMVTPDNRHTATFRCSFYDSLDHGCQGPVVPPPVTDWVSFQLVTSEGGEPVFGAKYTLELPDGRVVKGALDADGAAKITNTPAGTCVLRFNQYHAAEWDAEEDEDIELETEAGAFDEEEEEEAVVDVAGDPDSPFFDDDPDEDPVDDEDIQEP